MRVHTSGKFGRDIFIPATWPDFFLFLGLGLFLLLISARLAQVRVGSFPRNPFFWHYWVVAATRIPPVADESVGASKAYRSYMLFWAASLCTFLAGAVVLVAILSGNYDDV